MSTYRIQPVKNLQAGDLVKITRKRVESIREVYGHIEVIFTNGTTGVFFGDEKVGIYR